MKARLAVTLVLVAAGGWAREDTATIARLKAELKESHPYVAPVARDSEVAPLDEPVLKLEKMVVTISPAFEVDVLKEARRAVARREAQQFSLAKGGRLLAFTRGEVGFWPTIIPVNAAAAGRPGDPLASPVKKPDVMLVVDLLRLKW